MTFILSYQWELFIILEILSLVCLISFLVLRYAFKNELLSRLFLVFFLSLIVLEGILAFVVYQKTGEIDTFQIIIFIFIIYAFTFGIADFKRLDRWIKQKVGKWRGVDLLTEKDKKIIARQKDPVYRAKRDRRFWYVHTIIFILVHLLFFYFYGNPNITPQEAVTDWSWIDDFDPEIVPENGPYNVALLHLVTLIWLIVYAADTINALYVTIFKD